MIILEQVHGLEHGFFQLSTIFISSILFILNFFLTDSPSRVFTSSIEFRLTVSICKLLI